MLSLPYDWRILSGEDDVQDTVNKPRSTTRYISTQNWVTNRPQNLIPH